jgi:hypothetical protein
LKPSVPASVRHALGKLAPDDPVRPIVELVFQFEDPAITSAVVRKLLDELRAERSG